MFGFSCVEWTIPNVLIRIVVSMILGCVIGLDRGLKKRGAGTKTNTIVCLGATLVMLTAQYMEAYFPGKSDLSRMASQVISGVGFLGVGTIIVSGHQVRGLTTAASLWACACIGLAVGIGFLDGGVIITACVLISLHVLPRLEKYFFRRSKYLSVYVELEANGSISEFLENLQENQIQVDSMDVIKGKTKRMPYALLLTLRLPTAYKSSYVEVLEKIPGVTSVDVI